MKNMKSLWMCLIIILPLALAGARCEPPQEDEDLMRQTEEEMPNELEESEPFQDKMMSFDFEMAE